MLSVRCLLDDDQIVLKSDLSDLLTELQFPSIDAIERLKLRVVDVFCQIQEPTVAGIGELRIGDASAVPLQPTNDLDQNEVWTSSIT